MSFSKEMYSTLQKVSSRVAEKVLNSRSKLLGKFVYGFWVFFRSFILFGLSFVIMYPLIYMLTMSFRIDTDVLDPSVIWIPRNLTLINYIDAIKHMKYLAALKNSLFLTLGSSIMQIVACSAAGYGFARFSFKGKNLLFGLMLFTIIVPPQILYIPSYLGFRQFDIFGFGSVIGLFTGKAATVNLLNTYWTFYVPALLGAGLRGGLFVYIFRQFFRNMPKELEDAANIDGCGALSTFFRIVVPGAGPAFLTVFIFSIVWYWNDYYTASMYFANIKTVPLSLATLRDSFISSMEDRQLADPLKMAMRIQAGSLLTVGPILVVYLFIQRYFTESIERTGIVG